MAEHTPEQMPGEQPTATDKPEKLPLLHFFGHNTSAKESSGGFVGALIVGSIALAVASMTLVIAIGRAPQLHDAQQVAATVETQLQAPAPSTSYASPTPTGTRWTPEPIIIGVPQKGSPEPETPTATPSDDEDSERPQPSEGSTESRASANPWAQGSWGDFTSRPGNGSGNNGR